MDTLSNEKVKRVSKVSFAKETLKRNYNTFANYLPQIKYVGFFIYVNILIMIHITSALQMSKFFTLSIIKSQSGKEISRVHHYVFCGLFLILWILMFFGIFGVMVLIYIVYESSMYPDKNLNPDRKSVV